MLGFASDFVSGFALDFVPAGVVRDALGAEAALVVQAAGAALVVQAVRAAANLI